jgi:GTP cyclohydrolase I
VDRKKKIQKAVRQILRAVGEDPEREGLFRTPERVARAYEELLSGYEQDPKELLKVDFETKGYDQMVVLRGTSFYSLCEHHLLPFYGTVAVAYIPNNGRVAGLSKLARLVDCYARRLQIQERMTQQIASALEKHLRPVGWGVTIRAHHLCMGARGVTKPGSEMVTTALGGALRQEGPARSEYFAQVGL